VLRTGDVLLVQGARNDISDLKNRAGMLVIDNTVDLPHTRKAPIALGIFLLGVAPRAFVLAVMFGANMGYATPIAYQTNALILNAGSYRFFDFMRVGIPLIIIMWAAFTLLLPIAFQF
jgi:hypothetical protein